jgi:hypothetical protein
MATPIFGNTTKSGVRVGTPYKPNPTPIGSTPYNAGRKPTGVSSTVAGTSLPWYMNPSANARPDTQYDWQSQLDQSRTLSPAEQSLIQMQIKNGMTPNQPPPGRFPSLPGSGSRGGGGGGGGGAGPTGLDQATLDWLLGQIGAGKPQALNYNPLDLPDPRQYFGNFDSSGYDQARQGITTGLQGVQERANTSYDNALAELQRYQNPYGVGPQQQNPNYLEQFGAMARANDAGGQMNQTVGEGAQADRAFGNVYALMNANDAARQAGNIRANQADRRTTEQNLGIEGNMLNLGVNMAQAKGKSAWEQMLSQLGFDTASQEAATNWQRQNTVGDTNVANRNAWNSGLMQTLLSIIGSKAPGTTLPADTGGWYV